MGDLNQFTHLEHQKIVQPLIESGNAGSLCDHLEEIDQAVNRLDLAKQLIEKGYAHAVVSHLDKFPDRFHPQILAKLMEGREYEQVAIHADLFKGIDRKELVKDLLQAGADEYVKKYLSVI